MQHKATQHLVQCIDAVLQSLSLHPHSYFAFLSPREVTHLLQHPVHACMLPGSMPIQCSLRCCTFRLQEAALCSNQGCNRAPGARQTCQITQLTVTNARVASGFRQEEIAPLQTRCAQSTCLRMSKHNGDMPSSLPNPRNSESVQATDATEYHFTQRWSTRQRCAQCFQQHCIETFLLLQSHQTQFAQN